MNAFPAESAPDVPSRGVKALLFADIQGFSSFGERQCLAFFRHFHAGIDRDVLAPRRRAILTQNTWGDALHLVFDDLPEAGRTGLALQEWMGAQDWAALGFPAPPRLRVGLHAGLVTRVPDPIAGICNYVGRHTSRAARIEPIACEGQVYASGAYAALLALERVPDLALEYVGMRILPKNAGRLPLFLLTRRLP